VRFAVVLTITAACSTNAKREDGAPMPQQPLPPPAGSQAPALAVAAPTVYLAGPKGDVAVNVEVVATEPKIEKGLMFRQHLPLDAGMLFMMGFEKDWNFWMRNTLIPLDMIFIAKDMTVAGIVENAEPLTEEPLRHVGKPSLYVLEVNGGWTKQTGVVAGAKVRFENIR
jgi:uncharacterized membrane protein (UPF0127 family)